ncbi:hypothetical protein V6347_15585 [Acinetobacter baumannii]|uniref:hypothetical protein n=1 Tax=Acinetobacter baumannii TaxID=470 RepID=UPI003B843F2A
MEAKQPEVKEQEDILSLGLGGNVKKILIKAEKYHCSLCDQIEGVQNSVSVNLTRF